MTDDDKPRLEIDWSRTLAGALAAVSSAVLLSTLGAAGTIIGAALGSVVVTLGSALYGQGLARSRHRLAKAQTVALRKVGIAQAEVRRASRHQGDDEVVEGHLGHADQRLSEARHDLDAAVQEPALGWGERLALLPWKRLALLAAGLFVVVIVAITAFELVAGRSVSSYTGGSSGSGRTTISRVTGGGSGGDPAQDPPTPQPPSGDTTGPTPGAGPTTPAPSGTPEPTAPTTSTAPSSAPSSSPSSSPTSSPTDGSSASVPTLPSDSASAVPSP